MYQVYNPHGKIAYDDIDSLEETMILRDSIRDAVIFSFDRFHDQWRLLELCTCCGADVTHHECNCAHQLCDKCSWMAGDSTE